ncbi:hypothetical protein [Aeromonas sp. 603757]|uniref:hypothetical protein n=1 Tax=Aeromonas sp. 603757 TaxID=2712050 RepID=UPI003BA3D27A
MTNTSALSLNNPMSNKEKPKFIHTVRLIRKQQDVLEERGDPISLSVFDKLEAIMNGARGIRFTPQERGRQEQAFIIAKHRLKAEDAEYNWERFETCVHLTSAYHKASEANSEEARA